MAAFGKWMGQGGDSSPQMIVTNTPSTDLALTNCAYCSLADARRFIVPSLGDPLASVGNCMVLTLSPHNDIKDGHIALNAIHRRYAKVSTGDNIAVSRFVPPEDKFKMVLLTLDLEFVKSKGKNEELDATRLGQQFQKRFMNQVFTVNQRGSFEYCGTNYIFTVTHIAVDGQEESEIIDIGLLSKETYFIFETSPNSGIKITNQRQSVTTKIFRSKDFDLQKLGIGGLHEEFKDIFRRAFASRVLPPHIASKLGQSHVKGMLLHGPPGTGKTLIARQIGKMLNGREPKVVNGPEVLSKFVGETEKNVRDLFADAENDQRTRGDQSDLHVIIFDEIDAICKTRGSTRDGTGVHDGIVNQLLTKIDGVESLNNVLLIGMTNRKDLLDEALLRPGRLEIQIEIGLPDEKGRLQIFQIHTNRMRENSFLAADINLEELAARTKNYSGAEIEGVVKSATSFAINRQLSYEDLTKQIDEENIKVTMSDFLNAIQEVKPSFGAATDNLERCRLNGMVENIERHRTIYNRLMSVVEEVKLSKKPMTTCLLEGPTGSGKTAMAATIGIDSNFPFVKLVTVQTMIGLGESSKCSVIAKVFEDAYKSPLSIIILDEIDRITEFVSVGPRFSNLISQTLWALLRKNPPLGKKLLVIATNSEPHVLGLLGLRKAFDLKFEVPNLAKPEIRKVLQEMAYFSEEDLDAAVEAIEEIPIKKLYMLVEMAAQGENGSSAEAIYAGKEKIDLSYFLDCLRYVTDDDEIQFMHA